MKKSFFAWFAVIALLFTACPDPNNTPDLPGIITVQDAINKAENSITLLTEFTLKENSSLTVSKAITVNGGEKEKFDMKGASITVEASGVVLKNLKNIKEIIISNKIADGDFTLSGSSVEKITVNGGGSKSVHVEESEVQTLDVNKDDVRIVLEKGATVETTKVSANCTLDSEDKTAVFKNVTALETVKSVKLDGKANIEAFVVTSSDTEVKIETEKVVIEKAAVVTTDSSGTQSVTELKVTAGDNINKEDLPEFEILDEKEIEEIQEKLKDEPYNPNPEGNPYYIELIEEDEKPGITIKLNALPKDSTNIQYFINCTDGTEGGSRQQFVIKDAPTEYYYPFVTPGKTYEVYARLFSQEQEKTTVKTIKPKTGKGWLKPENNLNANYDSNKGIFSAEEPVFDKDIPTDGKYWINIFIGQDESKAVYSNYVEPADGSIILDITQNGDGEYLGLMAGTECRFSIEYIFVYNKQSYSIQILDNGWYKVTPTKNPETNGAYITLSQEDGKPGLTVKLHNKPQDATYIQYFIKCYDSIEIEDDSYFAAENAPLEYYYPFTTPGNTYSAQVQLGGTAQGMTAIKYLTVKDGLGCLTPTNDINPSYDTETNVFTCNTPQYSVAGIPADGKYSVNVCIGKDWDVATDLILQSSIPVENGKLILDFNKNGNENREKMAGKICFITISYDFTYNGQFYSAQLLKGSYFNFTPTKAPSTSLSEHMTAQETENGIEVTISLADDEEIVSNWGSLTENTTGLSTGININSKRFDNDTQTIGQILNEKKEYTIVFPFVKAGNDYSFSISGEYKKNGTSKWFGETLKIKAAKTNKTYGSVNPQNFNKSVPQIVYDAKNDKYTFTTSYTKTDFEEDFGTSLNDCISLHLVYFYGHINWSNCDAFAYRGTSIDSFLYDTTSSEYLKFVVDKSTESESAKKVSQALRNQYGVYCLSSNITIDTGNDGWKWDTTSTWTSENEYPEPFNYKEVKPSNTIAEKFDTDTNIFTCKVPVYPEEVPANGKYLLKVYHDTNKIYEGFVNPSNGIISFDLADGNSTLVKDIAGKQISFSADYQFTIDGTDYSVSFLTNENYLSTPTHNPDETYWITLVEEEGKPGFTIKLNAVPEGCTALQYNFISETPSYSASEYRGNKATEFYFPYVTAGIKYELYVDFFGSESFSTQKRFFTPKTGLGELIPLNKIDEKLDTDTNIFTCNVPLYSSDIPTNGKYWLNVYHPNGKIYGDYITPANGVISFNLADGDSTVVKDIAGQPVSFNANYQFTVDGTDYSLPFLTSGWYLETPTHNPSLDKLESARLSAKETDEGIEITIKLLEGEKTVNEWWSNLYEASTQLTTPIHLHAKKNDSDEKTIGEILNEGESYTILYPFVKAGTTYVFKINGEFKIGTNASYWGDNDQIIITATKTNSKYGNVYPEKWSSVTPTVIYDPVLETYTLTSDYTKADYESDFGTNVNDIVKCNFGYWIGEINFRNSSYELGIRNGISIYDFFYNSSSQDYLKKVLDVSQESAEKKAEFASNIEKFGIYCGRFFLSIVPEDGRKWETKNLWTAEVPYSGN